MWTSKLNSKFQVTLPKMVRDTLQLKTDDSVVFYVTTNGSVFLQKLGSHNTEYLKTLDQTLTGWDSAKDDEAFEHLQKE